MDRVTELVSIEEVKDTLSLDLLYNSWLELYKRSSSTTPFQSPDWIVPWWKIFGTERLFVLSIYNDSRLIGLAPFYIYKLKGSEKRQLTLIGTGNTDYLDIIAEDGFQQQVSDAVSSYLTMHSSEWDLCYFQGLLQWSILKNLRLIGNYVTELMNYNIYPEATLPNLFDDYVSLLSADFIKKIKYARHGLEKKGKLYFELAENKTRQKFLDDLFYLHKKSWNMRNKSGVLNGHQIWKFHEKATERLLRTGDLKFYRLKHKDRTIAAIYGMQKGKMFYSYLSGFDPELKKYSPGSVLIFLMMEDLINKGVRTFDFMMGNEAYKYRWGAKDKTVYKMVINKK